MTKIELAQAVLADESMINEISEKSSFQTKTYLAVYESERGITVGRISKGWDTRKAQIDFPAWELTKEQVIEILKDSLRSQQEYEQFLKSQQG